MRKSEIFLQSCILARYLAPCAVSRMPYAVRLSLIASNLKTPTSNINTAPRAVSRMPCAVSLFL
jgi:hypothetical protein